MATPHAPYEQEENFFASFTDLLVGILFIFIILLMVFATNFKKKESQSEQAIAALSQVNEVRDIVLEAIARRMKEDGIDVAVDHERGVLRLPESMLFTISSSDLSTDGSGAVAKMRAALIQYLPCIAPMKGADMSVCTKLNLPAQTFLEAVLVEGHASVEGEEKGVDNLTLSAERARSVFKQLTDPDPMLGTASPLDRELKNASGYPILGMSAYGSKRPVSDDMAKNRRIDIRFVMRTPTVAEAEALKNSAMSDLKK